MKIVFIGCKNIHTLGGIENYMLNLTRELTKIGHECVVWCESDHHEVEWADGVKIIYHPGPKNNLICKPWCGLKATIKTLIHEKNVDVIHYNAWPPSLWNWIPRIFGIKTLMQGHGLEWQRSKYSSTAQKVLKFMEMVTAYTNKHLIMCSEDQTQYFWATYHKKAITIPTAINLPAEHNNSSDILEHFGLEPHRYFLFLGRLVQDKNPDYLIKAFRISQHEKFKLVIAGSNDADKSYEESLRRLASDDESIVFTGAVYGEDKQKLLSEAYALCIPSTIEGLSIVLLEAMSYKLPIIASDIPANREPLGDNAVWVKPENEHDLANAIEFCINNEEIIQRFIPINYETITSKYTWNKIADKYVKYLQTILDSGELKPDKVLKKF